MHITLSTQKKPIQFTPKTWAVMPNHAHSPTIHHAHISSLPNCNHQLPSSQNPMTIHGKSLSYTQIEASRNPTKNLPTQLHSLFYTQLTRLNTQENLHIDQTRSPGHQRPHNTCLATSPEIWLPEFAKKTRNWAPTEHGRMRKLTEFRKPAGSRGGVGGIRWCGEMWRSRSAGPEVCNDPPLDNDFGDSGLVTGLRNPSGSFLRQAQGVTEREERESKRERRETFWLPGLPSDWVMSHLARHIPYSLAKPSYPAGWWPQGMWRV